MSTCLALQFRRAVGDLGALSLVSLGLATAPLAAQAELVLIDISSQSLLRPTVVGASGDLVRFTDGYVWRRGVGLQPAPGPSPVPPGGPPVSFGVDASGEVHVGMLGAQVCTWRDGGPLRILDHGGLAPTTITPSGVSVDGRVVVGTVTLAGQPSPAVAVWREGAGAEVLTPPAFGASLSLDGTAIAATLVTVVPQGMRWDWDGAGYTSTLLQWNSSNDGSYPYFVTPDASSVLGKQTAVGGPLPPGVDRVDVWTPNSIHPSTSPSPDRPRACSANGRRYVCQSRNFGPGPMSWAWTNQGLVETLLIGLGVSIPSGVQLEEAHAISLDGHFVAGIGVDASGSRIAWLASLVEVGVRGCGPASPNSRALPGSLSALGSASLAANDLSLEVALLPPQSIGVFLCSFGLGPPVPSGVGAGWLCLQNPIGYFDRPGELYIAGQGGTAARRIDLANLPVGVGAPVVLPGQTLHFQSWYRDEASAAGSNLTDALSVLVQ